MKRTITIAPAPEVPVFRTSSHRPDESDVVRRRAAAGELTRIGRGVFVESAGWQALRPAERHRLRIDTVADRIRTDQIVSHVSAAVVLAVPLVSDPPDRVHLTTPGTDRRTTNATFIVHADLDPVPDRRVVRTPDGLHTMGPERVAVDLALTLPLVDAVVARGDRRRGGGGRAAGRSALERRGPKCRRRALQAAEFADPRSDSPGESVGRVRFDQFGTEPPDLQHRFVQQGEPDIVVDFWFPEAGVVVEFEGEVKYRDAQMRAGRSAEDVVVAEKLREDRLRAIPGVRAVVRITWSDLWDETRLRALLRRAGVRMTR